MDNSNRNSKHVIKSDIKFIDEILEAIKHQDLQDVKHMLEDWKHELKNIQTPRSEHSCIRFVIRFLCQHPTGKAFAPKDVIRYVEEEYSNLNLITPSFTTVYNYINWLRVAEFVTRVKHSYYVGYKFINIKNSGKNPEDEITSTFLRMEAYSKYLSK